MYQVLGLAHHLLGPLYCSLSTRDLQKHEFAQRLQVDRSDASLSGRDNFEHPCVLAFDTLKGSLDLQVPAIEVAPGALAPDWRVLYGSSSLYVEQIYSISGSFT